jgi:hypothetical protein
MYGTSYGTAWHVAAELVIMLLETGAQTSKEKECDGMTAFDLEQLGDFVARVILGLDTNSAVPSDAQIVKMTGLEVIKKKASVPVVV